MAAAGEITTRGAEGAPSGVQETSADDPESSTIGGVGAGTANPEMGIGSTPDTASGGQAQTPGSDDAGRRGEDTESTAAQRSQSDTSGQGAESTGTKAPVVVGHFGTYSGVIGAVLQGGRQMAQVWAESVNARGGLNGHPVRIITADDGGDPAKAKALAQDMVENQGAIAFMGNLTPLSTNGYVDYLKSVDVPAVGGDVLQRVWYESPILFPQGTYIDNLYLGDARIAARSDKPKIGLLYCAEAESCATANQVLQDGGAERAGAQLVYSTQVSLAQPNFTRECLDAQNAGAQSLLVATDVNAISRVARDCSSQGYEPLLLTTALAAVNSAASDENLEGLTAPSLVFPWMANSTPATQEYQEAIDQYAPSLETSGATASVWAAGKLLEAATKDLSNAPTSREVIEGLYSLPDGFETEGLTPPLTFRKGEPATKPGCYSIVKLSRGEWTAPIGPNFECPFR